MPDVSRSTRVSALSRQGGHGPGIAREAFPSHEFPGIDVDERPLVKELHSSDAGEHRLDMRE
jgi:hypothetical protein